MDLKEIQKRNYIATRKRMLITDDTAVSEFIEKLNEETNELYGEMIIGNKTNAGDELADCMLVCLVIAEHYDIDIQKHLESKTVYNEKRKD